MQAITNETSFRFAARSQTKAAVAEYEVAVHVADVTRFRAVANELAGLLDCDPARAMDLLCASPAIVATQVPITVATALRERLEPLGASVDASRTTEALYHVYVEEQARELRAEVCRVLTEEGMHPEASGPLVAFSVARRNVATLLAHFGDHPSFHLLDRAFQRFDVVLESAPNTLDARTSISTISNLPKALVPKVLDGLPRVISCAKRWDEAAEALMALAEVGAVANAHLVTLTSYDVELNAVTDRRAAIEVLTNLGHQDELDMETLAAQLPARVRGGYGLVHAQWLVHELSLVGAQAHIVER